MCQKLWKLADSRQSYCKNCQAYFFGPHCTYCSSLFAYFVYSVTGHLEVWCQPNFCPSVVSNKMRHPVVSNQHSSSLTSLNECSHYFSFGTFSGWYIECMFFQNLTNLDRSRFVRRDRSNPVKKNTQIFLVVVGMVSRLRTVRRAPQTTPSFMNIHDVYGKH